ncbi:hypothetical protein JCM33374_g4571 [Metschnikowia sp. JCM 33374]|nr:hypothetical protein JCM33374_g4571 [Metschnikowia sp. JCM 33374]
MPWLSTSFYELDEDDKLLVNRLTGVMVLLSPVQIMENDCAFESAESSEVSENSFALMPQHLSFLNAMIPASVQAGIHLPSQYQP